MKIKVAMKNSRSTQPKADSRVKVSPLSRVVRQAIDVVATFGSGNLVNSTLPSNTPRKMLRRALRKKWKNITKAVVTFPNSDSVTLVFGTHRVSDLEA